jgi:hypothetical protein
MELTVRREKNIGDRNWSKRPLFGDRRRRYGHWLLLVVVLFIGALLLLFPHLPGELLAPWLD